MTDLLKNVHENFSCPIQSNTFIIRGNYDYYHYTCDGQNDEGWGCGYRTLQTICSWISSQVHDSSGPVKVPSMPDLQQALVSIGDKPSSFLGSHQWIGCVEAAMCIDYFYKVPCRLVHVHHGNEIKEHVPKMVEHFQEYGSPLMIGGDRDAASKGILGVCTSADKSWLLVLDPHLRKKMKNSFQVQEQGWVSWTPVDDFLDLSFYNICFPLLVTS